MNKNLKWVYNPFERIAGWQALFIGIAIMALTAVVGKLNQVTFAGSLYAYTVSCHLKGGKAIISFVGALLVAQIASQLIFIFLISSLFAGVPIKGVSTSGSKENIEAIDSLTIRQKTENVVRAFEQGSFNSITVYFDETMKKGLPPNGLRMAWMQTTLSYGKFEKADLDGMTESRFDNRLDIIEVPFYYAKGKLNLRLAFNEDGTIGGLFLLPAN